jgi:hypothetical protein
MGMRLMRMPCYGRKRNGIPNKEEANITGARQNVGGNVLELPE